MQGIGFMKTRSHKSPSKRDVAVPTEVNSKGEATENCAGTSLQLSTGTSFMVLSHRRRSRKVPLRPVVCAGISNGRCSVPGHLYHQLRSCDFAKEKRRHWAILAEERSIRVSKHVRASMQQSMLLKEEQAEVPWGVRDYIHSSLIFTAPCNRSEKWKSRGVLQSHVKIVILLADQWCTCKSPASPRPPVCLGALVLESQVRVGLFGSGVGLSLVLGFGVAYACYYLSSIAKKPQLVASNKRFCRFLKEYCPVVTETYYPTIWCWEGRVQTLLRPFITSRPQVQYRNELIRTADGGQISLDWFDNNDSLYYPDASTRPTVLLLPGLTGTSKESYILHMIHQSETLGYRCVVFNNRGIAGEDLLTPRTYCAANTEDLEAVIHHIHSLHPSAPFMAAGVSMGGHRQMLEKLFDMDLVMKARTVREFDKQFTSVMFGYRTIDDYYEDASPCRKLKSVGIPVLCLNSVDDVFSPGHAIPVETAKQNANVALVLTSCGGHIGFLEGIWPRKCTYMDRVFKQFVQAVFEHGNKIFSM
ncbi:phospholipase ABHD3 isoform X2 [Cygnus olor]|uniref:phospholipase ABHD3 isoform X2 n=1 Tax=Cygnus olor TaxID=8869 RepID=UPI001ADE6345|nr:phospholipase ABHD3 isoform X2 [Cygnus olor]